MIKLWKINGEEITDKSWRSRFYGLIQDGDKNRISPFLLKLAATVLVIMTLIIQFFSASRYLPKTQNISSFGVPVSVDPDQKLNLPVYAPGRDYSSNYETNKGLRKAKESTIERLRPIKLTAGTQVLTALQVSALLSMGASNGMVIAETTEALIVNGETVFPQGTKFYGKGSSSEERLYIEFKKAIFPDRLSQKIKAQGLDVNDLQLGIKGKKISDVAFKIAASSGLIFLSGLAEGLKQEQSIFRKPSVGDAALNGIATASSKQGEKVLQSMDADANKIEVKVKTPIIVMFDDFDGKE